MNSHSISKISARFYAVGMVIATMLVVVASISPAFGQGRSQNRDTPTPITGKGVKVTPSGTNAGVPLGLFDTDSPQLTVKLLRSAVVTSSDAQPGVYGAARAVRGEARGAHPNTTSSKGLLQMPLQFGGVWNTVTDKGHKFVMILTETYDGSGVVTGSYKPSRGVINGTMSRGVLRFTWRQKGGAHGAGRFVLSPDRESFQGTFSTTDNPDDTSGGTWNGTRRSRR